MKLSQSTMESISTSVWMDEIWTILQCSILLVLGYMVTRAWLWYRKTLLIKAKLLQISAEDDDITTESSDNQEVETSIASNSPTRATAARRANAELRKRMRRRGSELSNDPQNVDVDFQGTSTQQKLEEDAEQLVVELQAKDFDTQENLENDTKAEDVQDSDGFMSQRKQKKNKRKTTLDSSSSEHIDESILPKTSGACAPPNVMETIGSMPIASEVLSVHTDETSLPQSTPTCATDNVLETIGSAHLITSDVVTETCAVDHSIEIPFTLHESPPVDDTNTHVDRDTNGADNEEVDTVVQHEIQKASLGHLEELAEHFSNQDVLPPYQESSNYLTEFGPSAAMPCNIDWDLIESDSEDELDIGMQTFDSPRRDSAPILFCSAPHTPVNNDNSSGFTPSVDGWVAVAIPTECTPPGTLDGRWMNGEGEKILIDRLDIMFESGITWTMTMHLPTQISVDVEGVEFTAELEPQGERLIWSDGDVWDFHGQAEIDDQSQRVAEELQIQWPYQTSNDPAMQPEVPLQQNWDCKAFGDYFASTELLRDSASCIMWDGMTMAADTSFVMSEQTFVEQPPLLLMNQMIPADAKDWEICWDWKNKGFCPRGAACDWFHPATSGLAPCQPCEIPFY